MSLDVIAVGGGFSGLVTACRAAELGCKAAVLEERPEALYPCSSRYSTGVFGVMGISLMNPPGTALRRDRRGHGPSGEARARVRRRAEREARA